MRAIQLHQPREFRFVEVDDPTTPGGDEALVRIHRVGICGTDYGGYLGKMPFYSYPRVPGHELGVEVMAVGADVPGLRSGDRCAVEPYLNCRQCYSCHRGFTNCCESHRTLGVMCDGGLCERMILPARKLHRSAVLSYDQLALVETLAIGCHAVDRAHVRAGENVLVIGAGPIGLSAIEFVRVAGANCIVLDTNPARLEFCSTQLGVAHTIQARGDGSELIALGDITRQQLADVVIDATGNSQSMAAALQYATFGGRVVYVGITQQELAIPHAPVWHRRELSVLASRNALSRDFARIIALIEDGQISTAPWITHRAAFAEMVERFPQWLEPSAGVVKAMVALT